MEPEKDLRAASFIEDQVPDYNMQRLGELVPGVLEKGGRAAKVNEKARKKLSPTNSERMNRALVELGLSAFKIHTLLWKWRGAPARGSLPYFTVHSLSRFCSLSRPTVRVGLRELVDKGWIAPWGYNKHHKNTLYRLVPIRDVELPLTGGGKSPPLEVPPD